MLNHTPKDRPTAIDARVKYKEFVEVFTCNFDKESQIDELLGQLLDIGNKPTRRRRLVRRRRLSRHRNVM